MTRSLTVAALIPLERARDRVDTLCGKAGAGDALVLALDRLCTRCKRLILERSRDR